MELWQQMICRILQKEAAEVNFPQSHEIAEIFEMECYKALQRIKEIIADDELDDEECFFKIEEIICLFEDLGSNGESRHDFG